MRRISSSWTFYYKRVFPMIWFGFLVLFVGFTSFAGSSAGSRLPFVIIPILLGGFGYYLMQKLIFDLVDEVWDDGDALVVKNRDHEQRIALADVKNLNYTVLTSPPRVTLSLRRPTVFGDSITFCPPVRFVPFAKSSVINELIERIDAARERRA
jgi:hypothetical protein